MDLLGSGRGIGHVLKTRVGDVNELSDTGARSARTADGARA
jgi:hypothetical protein